MDSLHARLQSALGAGYVISRELGGGGMSRVFLAEETSLGRRVVIKVLAPAPSAGFSAERFRREIRLAAQLQHPHIVPVLQAGESGARARAGAPCTDGVRARVCFAIAYSAMGSSDRAYGWLARAVENRDPSLAENWFDPSLEELHADSRWAALLERMGVRQ